MLKPLSTLRTLVLPGMASLIFAGALVGAPLAGPQHPAPAAAPNPIIPEPAIEVARPLVEQFAEQIKQLMNSSGGVGGTAAPLANLKQLFESFVGPIPAPAVSETPAAPVPAAPTPEQ